uniref:Cytochrome b n=1 Tax=Bursaphelenchus mucronatus TaxID=6325 RepID=M4JFJ2_BURMU|nr:cytochrome b [Bursaphelenchus mucronatus]AGC41354.1 cytochrome b [Bursaphelenchus mucronatus]
MKGLLLFIKGLLINLPTSKSLSLYWNFGSQLALILIFQIFSGTFLVFYYSADSMIAFSSVQYIMTEVNFGWLFRIFHFNGASLFFIFLYLHFFKALFFNSYRLFKVWSSGLVIFLCIMMEAFMGYVLVWAQMSFWASVVITSLLSVIPVWGPMIVSWIWSGFSVSGATLKFFFVLHFILPWLFLVLVLLHLIFLHDTGSTSKILTLSDFEKINFYYFFWWKDGLNLLIWMLFFVFSLFFPFFLGDPEMFIEADPNTYPVHIVPEWYFLFAYAILRAIPNKILGVCFLLLSILVFFFIIVKVNFFSIFKNFNFFIVFIFIFTSIYLSWLGQCVVETPFLFLSGLFSFLYFFLIFLIILNYNLSNFLFK